MTTEMNGHVIVKDGEAFAGRTRVPVHHIMHVWQTSRTGLVQEVTDAFTELTPADAMAAIAYALDHPEVVEAMHSSDAAAVEASRAYSRPVKQLA